jgi:integrase
MSDLIRAHLRHLESRGLSPRTVEGREVVLGRLERELPLGVAHATTEELEHFLAGWTRCTYYTHIVGFFRWATDPTRLHLDYDPSAGLIRPRSPKGRPRPVGNEQLVYALNHLPEPWTTYVRLAAYAGARCCEIATLRREDIAADRIRIKGKGGRTRVLKTHPEIWRAVEHFPAGRIATTKRGKVPSARYISVRGAAQLDAIGLTEVTLHMFRHWYGTMMHRPKEFGGAGASLRAVQENLGHASPATTAIYTAVSDEERDAGIAALPTFTTPDPC